MRKFDEMQAVIEKASLLRRIAAMCYDSLLCIALMFVTTGIYMMASAQILGVEEYKAMNSTGSTINDPFLTVTLLTVLFGFFGYFWTRTGQTLGMQVWHIRVQTENQHSISWKQAFTRFLTAFISAGTFGLGYLWIIFDKHGRSWQCILSRSEVVRIAKQEK